MLAVTGFIVMFSFSAMTFASLPITASAASGGVLRMTLVGIPESLNQLTASPGCISCWQVMELEYAFGLPVQPNGQP